MSRNSSTVLTRAAREATTTIPHVDGGSGRLPIFVDTLREALTKRGQRVEGRTDAVLSAYAESHRFNRRDADQPSHLRVTT